MKYWKRDRIKSFQNSIEIGDIIKITRDLAPGTNNPIMYQTIQTKVLKENINDLVGLFYSKPVLNIEKITIPRYQPRKRIND